MASTNLNVAGLVELTSVEAQKANGGFSLGFLSGIPQVSQLGGWLGGKLGGFLGGLIGGAVDGSTGKSIGTQAGSLLGSFFGKLI